MIKQSRFPFGVSWDTRVGMWRVALPGGPIRLKWGTDDAALAREFDRAAVAYFGTMAKLNFPKQQSERSEPLCLSM